MQFFPAVDQKQAFAANSRFDFMDARTGQDFSDLLSRHLDQSGQQEQAWPASASLAEPETTAARGQDMDTPACEAGRSVRQPGPETAPAHGGAEDASAHGQARDVSQGQDSGASSHADRPSDDVDAAAEDADGSAKAAGPGDEKAEKAGRGPDDSHPHEEAVHAAAHEPTESPVASDPEAVALEEALAGVVRAVHGREAVNPEVEDRIAALRELLDGFRQADPAQRSALAVSLGAQIRALKEECASGKTEKNAGGVSNRERQGEAASVAAEKSGSTLSGRFAKEKAGRDVTGGASETGLKTDGAGRSAERARVTDSDSSRATSADHHRKHVVGQEVSTDGEVASDVQAGADTIRPRETADRSGEKAARRAGEGKLHAEVRDEKVPQENSETKGEASAVSAAARKDAQTPVADVPVRPQRDAAPREAGKGHAAAQAVESVGRNEKAAEKSGLSQAQAGASADARYASVHGAAGDKGEQGRQDARQGFFASASDDKARTARASSPAGKNVFEAGSQPQVAEDKVKTARVPSPNGKNVFEAGIQSQATGQNLHSTAQQRSESSLGPRSAEVYRQVETGAFKNLGQGVKQLVIRLDPEELGQVSVILQVKGKEVQAVLRASNQEASQALGEQLGQLRTQLEAQGLKVGKLEVQAQLADSQEQSQWQGAEQHNRYQENRELALSAQRWRTLDRLDAGLVRDVQNGFQREKLSSGGLDIFA